LDWFTRSLQECTPWIYFVCIFEVMIVALVLERTVALFFTMGFQFHAVEEVIEKLLSAGNLEKTKKIASVVPAPYGRVMAAALAAFDGNPSFVKDAADKAAKQEGPVLYRRLGRLALLGVGCALVGVAGTVMLQRQSAAPGPGPLPFGLALSFSPALEGGVAGLVALVAACVFGLRAWVLSRRLALVPAFMSRLGYAWADRRESDPTLEAPRG
jgi:hypothetical protein